MLSGVEALPSIPWLDSVLGGFMRRMSRLSRFVLVAAAGALTVGGWALTRVHADNEPDLVGQKEKQKQVKADTEFVARKAATMLHLLQYQGVKGNEAMLKEVASELGQLSKEQMSEVISHLDKAAKAKTEGKSKEEVDKAYTKHREIMDALQKL